MENKNLKYIIFGVAVVAVIGTIWFFTRTPSDSCEYRDTIRLADRFLPPFLSEEVKLDHAPNYYHCNKPSKGDLVLYQKGDPPILYPRVIVAVAGDEARIQKDAEHHGWNLVINGEVYMADGDKPYFFGVPDTPSVLSLYMPDGKRILGNNEFIALATNPPGFNDSGLFGLMSIVDTRGRLFFRDEKQQADYAEFVKKMFSKEGDIVNTSHTKEPTTEKSAISRNKKVAPPAKKPNQGKPN